MCSVRTLKKGFPISEKHKTCTLTSIKRPEHVHQTLENINEVREIISPAVRLLESWAMYMFLFRGSMVQSYSLIRRCCILGWGQGVDI